MDMQFDKQIPSFNSKLIGNHDIDYINSINGILSNQSIVNENNPVSKEIKLKKRTKSPLTSLFDQVNTKLIDENIVL